MDLATHAMLSYLTRDNVALMVKLIPVGSKGHGSRQHRRQQSSSSSVAVSTTHLLYNPKRDDVRLAQAVLMMAGKWQSLNYSLYLIL